MKRIAAYAIAFVITFWLGGFVATHLDDHRTNRYEIRSWNNMLVRVDKRAGTFEILTPRTAINSR